MKQTYAADGSQEGQPRAIEAMQQVNRFSSGLDKLLGDAAVSTDISTVGSQQEENDFTGWDNEQLAVRLGDIACADKKQDPSFLDMRIGYTRAVSTLLYDGGAATEGYAPTTQTEALINKVKRRLAVRLADLGVLDG